MLSCVGGNVHQNRAQVQFSIAPMEFRGQRLRALAAWACIFLFSAVDSTFVRQDTVRLRSLVASPGHSIESASHDVQASLEASLAGLFAHEPQQGDNQKTTKQTAGQQPVSVQVPQEEIKDLMKKLSKQCGAQFSGILDGKGPALHNFGDAGTNTSAASCKKLQGSLCFTQARVVQEKDDNGRRMQSAVNVHGNGCLPASCVKDKDLQHLTGFMRQRARDAVPGVGVHVQLQVDCTKSGGSQASVGNVPEDMQMVAP